jgi:hypothetical protein
MKQVDLNSIAKAFPRRNIKTLAEISADVDMMKGAINPYTIAAQNIISELEKHFIFPFLQPIVINTLEATEEAYYAHDKNGTVKFPRIKMWNPVGMDLPAGYTVLQKNGLPYLEKKENLPTMPGTVTYRVNSLTSFKRFARQLVNDLQFLMPIYKEVAYSGIGSVPDKGDVVLIPDQGYGKLAIVEQLATKDYHAILMTPEGIHPRFIGTDDVELDIMQYNEFNQEFIREVSNREIAWIDEYTQISGTRYPLGSALTFYGASIMDEDYQPRGYVILDGYDTRCAVVRPISYDLDEHFPWGRSIEKLAIPLQNVLTLGKSSYLETEEFNRTLFADDAAILDVIENISRGVINDKRMQSLMLYIDYSRYSRVLGSLLTNLKKGDGLVGARLVNLLTRHNIEGIERLAELAGLNEVDLASELLNGDIDVAKDDFHTADSKIYAGYQEGIDRLLAKHTAFKTLSALLKKASPSINLYQMPRDGSSTIAYIRSYEMGYSDFPVGIKNQASYSRAISEPRFADVLKDEEIWSEFMDINHLPDPSKVINEDNMIEKLLCVEYRIFLKENTIRYGRNENDAMTFPELSFIDETFVMPDIHDKFQLEFIDDVLNKVIKAIDFKGKQQFKADYSKLIDKTRKKLHETISWSQNMNEKLLASIRPLYFGIQQLSNDEAGRDRLALGLLKEHPLLLEAYHDFHALQKIVAIRDYYYRKQPHEGKNDYLSQFGWPVNLKDHFEEAFYAALVRIDYYHRGFEYNEQNNVTRRRDSMMRMYGEPYESSIGNSPSTAANRLAEHISRIMKKLDKAPSGKNAGLIKP